MVNKVNSYILWGSAGHAKVLAEIIYLTGGRVTALFDNADVPSAIAGVPIFIGESSFHNWAERQGDKITQHSGLVAIGGARGTDRLNIHKLFKQYSISEPSLVHPSAVVSNSAQIGIGCQILALGCVAAEVKLGESCIVNHKASVDHECTLGNGVHIGPGATLCGSVRIGDNVFIGAGTTILPNLNIGDNTIIGAGSVVTRDVPSNSVFFGNPAKNHFNFFH